MNVGEDSKESKQKYYSKRKSDLKNEYVNDWLKGGTEEQNEPGVKEDFGTSISDWRILLPQVVAVSSINLILLDLGMVLAFPTIVIPELLNSTSVLKFTEEQASWFGSIAFICQPIGSILSGFLFEPIGRKKTMIYVNLPLFFGWILMYFGSTITYLYVAGFIMGTSIGFLDAPHITYLGEITQPKYRGILTAYAELCIALGYSFVYFLGTTTDWKTIAAICSSIPVFAFLFISQVPESPVWLLSKGRKREAERSLYWLRGWSKSEAVQKEFSDLVHHIDTKYGRNKDEVESQIESEPLNPNSNWKTNPTKKMFRTIGIDVIFQKSIFRPLFLIVVYFLFSHTAGVSSTRPFMVDILKEFGTPLDAYWVTAISSVVGIVGFISGMILLPKTGKRMLSILSILGCAIVNILIFIYGTYFKQHNMPMIPVLLFILLNFMWSVGIGQIPWMLISEVFPFKGRGIASGISAATSYILAFIFTKSYYDMYYAFTLSGVFGFYGICMIIGCIFLCYFLPETEGKTLEQIESVLENHFNNISQKCHTNSDSDSN